MIIYDIQIIDMSTSKTGKHGHAKVHLIALDVRSSRFPFPFPLLLDHRDWSKRYDRSSLNESTKNSPLLLTMLKFPTSPEPNTNSSTVRFLSSLSIQSQRYRHCSRMVISTNDARWKTNSRRWFPWNDHYRRYLQRWCQSPRRRTRSTTPSRVRWIRWSPRYYHFLHGTRTSHRVQRCS